MGPAVECSDEEIDPFDALMGIEAAEVLPLALPGVVAVRVTAKGGAVGTALIKLGGGGAPTLLELLQGEHTLAHASSKEGKVLLAVVSPRRSPPRAPS